MVTWYILVNVYISSKEWLNLTLNGLFITFYLIFKTKI